MMHDFWIRHEITERFASVFGRRLPDWHHWKVYRWLGRDHCLSKKNYKRD